VKSSNPVLGRLVDRSTRHASFHRAPAPQAPPGAPGYAGDYGQPPVGGGYAPVATGRRMTIDDVVVRTVGLLAVVGLTGALAWMLVPRGISMLVLFGAAGIGLILGLIVSFKGITNPVPIVAYAAIEGVLVGVISRAYEDAYSGIVVQAVVGTFGVFFTMAMLYKFRVIRATPTFVKWVIGALIGVLLLMVVNFLAVLIGGGDGLGLRSGGPLAIGFSLLCIGVAALTFILDFKAVEDGVNAGVDQKFAWYASFGILVGLIWLYLEILRLIGFLRSGD
jgi:uncharacterized YccA/Bax inhibitor family protein